MKSISYQEIMQAVKANDIPKMKEGKATCSRLLAKNSKDIISLRLISAIEQQLGNYEAAEKWLKKALALQPNSVELQYRYAQALMSQNQLAEASIAFSRTIALKPDYVDAHYNLGLVFERQGEDAQALKSYLLALELRPDHPKILNKVGMIQNRQGNLSAAAEFFERASAANPENSALMNNLGVVYANCGKFDLAESCYRRALALRPNYPEALNNWGKLAHYQGDFSASIAYCRQALRSRPQFPEALNILGSSLQAMGYLPEAIDAYEKAIALKSDNPGYHTNLALALLTAGHWAEGWEKYEWRLKTHQLEPEWKNIAAPRWQGQIVKERVTLIKAEQGLGDTLQFCRYIPLVLAQGAQILLEVQSPLVRLMEPLLGTDRVFAQGQPLPPYDDYCPIMSLPHLLKTRSDNIPASIPYLFPRQADLSHWEKLLPPTPGLLKVGLVWAGNSRAQSPGLVATDRRRSIAPEMFSPLMDIRGVQYYSLQKIGPSAPAHWNLIDFMADCRDFADTAALIAHLDLVISVDTAVAHLAGALGKPVWLLNRFDTCWRWQLGHEDSPWYPTLRLFRQQQPGNWRDVIIRIKRELTPIAVRYSS